MKSQRRLRKMLPVISLISWMGIFTNDYMYILKVYKGWSKIIGINKMFKSKKWFIKLVAAI